MSDLVVDSRSLKPGDVIMLAYDNMGGTIPPDRIVRVRRVTDDGFDYDLLKIRVEMIDMFVPKGLARIYGIRFREGRWITHVDFRVNMAERTRFEK